MAAAAPTLAHRARPPVPLAGQVRRAGVLVYAAGRARVSPAHLAAEFGLGRFAAYAHLAALCRAGQARRVAHGLYTTQPEADAP